MEDRTDKVLTVGMIISILLLWGVIISGIIKTDGMVRNFLLVMSVVAAFSTFLLFGVIIDYIIAWIAPQKPEYKIGYNDYPDRDAYLDMITFASNEGFINKEGIKAQYYLNGWRDAEKDQSKRRMYEIKKQIEKKLK